MPVKEINLHKKSFADLGLSITNNEGKLKSQEEMFNETVIALQNMEEGPKKAALATDLLGKSASELAPLINGAAGSVEDMRQQANELGLVLSDDSVDAGVKFTDSIDQAKRSLMAVVTTIGVQVMPIVQKLLEWVMDKMPVIQSVLGKVFDGISLFVEVFVSVISDLYVAFNENFGWIIDVVANFISGFRN